MRFCNIFVYTVFFRFVFFCFCWDDVIIYALCNIFKWMSSLECVLERNSLIFTGKMSTYLEEWNFLPYIITNVGGKPIWIYRNLDSFFFRSSCIILWKYGFYLYDLFYSCHDDLKTLNFCHVLVALQAFDFNSVVNLSMINMYTIHLLVLRKILYFTIQNILVIMKYVQ